MAEVQDNAVGEAVLERNLARARTVGSDVLYGVHVGAGVVALDDRIGGGQLVHAILIRPDPLREVLPGIEHQHLRRIDAGKVTISRWTGIERSTILLMRSLLFSSSFAASRSAAGARRRPSPEIPPSTPPAEAGAARQALAGLCPS